MKKCWRTKICETKINEAVSLHAGSESAVPVSGVGNTPPGSPYDERPLAPTAYSLTNGGIHGGAVPPAHSDLTYASMPIAATSYAMANAKIHPTTGSPQLQPPQSKLASSLSPHASNPLVSA